MPAFADDVELAKLADDDETEAEIARTSKREAPGPRRRGGAPEPLGGSGTPPRPAARRGAEGAEARAPDADGDGRAGAVSTGDAANPESAERRKRNDERRAKRAQRRKAETAMSEVAD